MSFFSTFDFSFLKIKKLQSKIALIEILKKFKLKGFIKSPSIKNFTAVKFIEKNIVVAKTAMCAFMLFFNCYY